MHKLLPLLALIVTASISAGRPAAAEGRFAGPLPGPFATDVAGPDATVVFVAGMGGGTTSGGMRGGTTGGNGRWRHERWHGRERRDRRRNGGRYNRRRDVWYSRAELWDEWQQRLARE